MVFTLWYFGNEASRLPPRLSIRCQASPSRKQKSPGTALVPYPHFFTFWFSTRTMQLVLYIVVFFRAAVSNLTQALDILSQRVPQWRYARQIVSALKYSFFRSPTFWGKIFLVLVPGLLQASRFGGFLSFPFRQLPGFGTSQKDENMTSRLPRKTSSQLIN